jgi:hypothetical protein
MAARTIRGLGLVLSAPIVIAVAVVLSPVLLPLLAARFLGHLWHATRLRARWPAGKFVLLAYTDSELWAPYIENTLLPQIGDHCVVVNRSREDWKRRYAAERQALSFWGGLRSYNPIAVVVRPWGRVRVFRFYDAFQQLKHGQPGALDTKAAELVGCVREAVAKRT